MNFSAFIQTILYIVSSSLLIPVMVLLVFLLVWILFITGMIFSEWVERKRLNKISNTNLLIDEVKSKKMIPSDFDQYFTLNVRRYFNKLNKLIENRDELLEIRVENLIQEKELKMLKESDKIKILIRIGPSLGLMGTLIPMGTALASISKGDLNQLSSNLVIAFTTTVVGLGLGMLSYFYSVIKERWVQEDMKNMEVLTETFLSSLKR